MKCQTLYSGKKKNKKNISKRRLLNLYFFLALIGPLACVIIITVNV